jgi:hypothetical protein
MKLGHFARRVGSRAVTRRIVRSWPLIGGAIAVLTIAGTVRRKGLLGGTLDTALNAMPFVGTVKNLMEARRGRDYIPHRPAYQAQLAARQVSR